MRLGRCLLIALTSFGAVMPALVAPDPPGTADHAAIARFKGSTIVSQERKDFGAYLVPLGPPDKTEAQFQKQQSVEGKVLKTLYDAPPNTTATAVYRSYQAALQQAGFDTLYTCENQQCSATGRLSSTMFTVRGYNLSGAAFDNADAYLLAARQAKSDTYVVMYVSHIYGHPEHVAYLLDVIEPKPLEGGLVTISAAVLASSITAAGHASVYGIYFDTGKAIIKPESKPVLNEIAKLLKTQPDLKLHVVGHTDNVGQLTANMTLSKQRADAVVAALVSQYQIAAGRLQAGGVGPLSPVATNRTEDGRSKNRRVELVEQ